MNTGVGFCHRWGRNCEFCVAVSLVTGTASILAYCMPAQWGLTVACSAVKVDELPRDGPYGVCINLILLLHVFATVCLNTG